MSTPDNGGQANAILRKRGLPPVAQMTEEQREELRTALGLPTRSQLSAKLRDMKEKVASAPKVKPSKMKNAPNPAQMLNSIIDWKIDALRKELTGKDSAPSAAQIADNWLSLVCQPLFECVPRLAQAGLIERTASGYDVKFRQAAFVMLLHRCGFSNWKALGNYFTIKGRAPKGDVLKKQAVASCPKDWDKVKAAIPEL